MNQAQLRGWAAWGARNGPGWFVELAPLVIGLIAFCVAKKARRAVIRNLRRIHGTREMSLDLYDAAKTFVAFAHNLTESLCPERFLHTRRLIVRGGQQTAELLKERGLILATAHVGPWDNAAMAFSQFAHQPVLMLMAEEQDHLAAGIQDRVRTGENVQVLRLGSSPLSALSTLTHLEGGGVVVAQMDRAFGRRALVQTHLFDAPFWVSNGLIRLAAVSGCPLQPVFMARLERGARLVRVGDPIRVPYHPKEDEVEQAAQLYVSQLEAHLRQFPSQWFHFVDDEQPPAPG